MSAGIPGGVTTRGRQRDLIELCVGYGLILIVIWTPRPWQRGLYVVAAVYLAWAIWRGFESLAAMGLRRANLVRSSWVVGAALGAAGVAVAVAWKMHTLHGVEGGVGGFVGRYWGYAIWAFAQQILLQDFFLGRLLRMGLSRRAAVGAAAGIFCAAHLPNLILVGVTLVWGVVSCAVFLRYRNLVTLGVAHAVLGIAVAIAVPGPVVRNMRVGLGYLRYSHGRHGVGVWGDAQRSH